MPESETIRWNEPIAESLQRLWLEMSPARSLLPDLAFDAVLARADHGELRACLPRLLELVTLPGADPELAMAVFDRIGSLSASALPASVWSTRDRTMILDLCDLWWETELALEPGEPAVHDVLSALVRLDVPVVRWLEPWLRNFDGPGARHLIRLVADGLHSARWHDVPDRRQQVLSWTRTEPVVIGLTLVGGVHLEPGELGDALDRML